MKKEGWTLYILECSDKSLYSGITKTLKKTLIQVSLYGGSYFNNKKRLPVKLVFSESSLSFKEAFLKLGFLRKMKRYQKLNLIKSKKWYYRHLLKINNRLSTGFFNEI